MAGSSAAPGVPPRTVPGAGRSSPTFLHSSSRVEPSGARTRATTGSSGRVRAGGAGLERRGQAGPAAGEQALGQRAQAQAEGLLADAHRRGPEHPLAFEQPHRLAHRRHLAPDDRQHDRRHRRQREDPFPQTQPPIGVGLGAGGRPDQVGQVGVEGCRGRGGRRAGPGVVAREDDGTAAGHGATPGTGVHEGTPRRANPPGCHPVRPCHHPAVP